MQKCIVYTRFEDGGVAIFHPTDDVIAWMGCGGYWNDFPRGYMDVQIERMIGAGHLPDASYRFAHALQFGGRTMAEALGIIRDRCCAHLGMAIELWDLDELPQDRWFRNAWRRSHNGGPIYVDLGRARTIQFGLIKSAVDIETMRRSAEMELFDVPLQVDLLALRERVRAARDEHQLRAVWPACVRTVSQS